MDPVPIPPSMSDLERRRLESTIDNDLHSLSLASLPTTTTSHSHSHSFISSSSNLSLEYPRAEPLSMSSNPLHHYQHQPHYSSSADTPRASRQTKTDTFRSRISSYGGGAEQSMFVGASPVSTAGHHASAVTLGAGVFKYLGGGDEDGDADSEFDPERSLGRLVGELGRVMGIDKLPARPSSPFSPPRSPSPLPSLHHSQPANLSFTLARNDPLLSPPSSGENTTIKPHQRPDPTSRFSSLARELGDELRASRAAPIPQLPRRALSDSTAHNIARTPGPSSAKKVSSKERGDRLRALQDENRRSASAPVRGSRDASADVTGLTALMATPAKGGEYGSINKNGNVGGDAGAAIPQTLAILHARLRALETENSVSRRRVRELEEELERAKSDVEAAKRDGGSRLREVIGEKSALEDLVTSLRAHLSRLTVELEHNKALVTELRLASQTPAKVVHATDSAVASELASLRREIERLSKEVERLGGIVEEGLETRKKARGERTIRMEQEEAARLARELQQEESEDVKRARRDMERRRVSLQQATSTAAQAEPSRLRQGLHAAAVEVPTTVPPTVQPNRVRPVHPTPPPSDDGSYDSPTPTARSASGSRQSQQRSLTDPEREREAPKTAADAIKRSKRSSRSYTNPNRRSSAERPGSPFPSIIGDELEKEFFSPLKEKEKTPWNKEFTTAPTVRIASRASSGSHGRREQERAEGRDAIPPQTVLARVVAELEDDFAHYKAIYAELADQYKLLDPASVSAKRHVLAEHLKEVIDTLEQKADQIGSLYELLTFADRPLPPNTNTASASAPGGAAAAALRGEGREKKWAGKSVGDVMRMVRDSLGEEAWDRLEADLGSGRGGR